MSSRNPPKLPQINFSGLEYGTGEWAAVQSQVMEVLKEFSCFEVVCDDKLTPELREAFFGKAIKEPFGLPFETKLRSNTSDNPFKGYIHNISGMDYESLIIPNCGDPESVNDFTKLTWGDEGNPSFRTTIYLKELWNWIEKQLDGEICKSWRRQRSIKDSHVYWLRDYNWCTGKSRVDLNT